MSVSDSCHWFTRHDGFMPPTITYPQHSCLCEDDVSSSSPPCTQILLSVAPPLAAAVDAAPPPAGSPLPLHFFLLVSVWQTTTALLPNGRHYKTILTVGHKRMEVTSLAC